ncbi:Uncharacterised protein [Serratia fonticola]|nr:Uncharacterised protein [Serratia fonticola]CAI0944610.1 Uncharacterised protein [Serratia fonticola]CAI1743679.1 Uncharacterised protein [Serratia fonticola]CAI1801049.1 Uncharacterised protein [Serratia fonticola]CAI1807623.1 Uncharacterised protein [Serratia fonticola]
MLRPTCMLRPACMLRPNCTAPGKLHAIPI